MTISCNIDNLLDGVDAAPTGIANIVALNQGSLTVRVLRLAALSNRDALVADGYGIAGSAGPCVLGFKADDLGGYELTMIGPSGLHHVYATRAEVQAAGQVATGRVRVHWLGFLAANGVEVPADLLAKAEKPPRHRGRRGPGLRLPPRHGLNRRPGPRAPPGGPDRPGPRSPQPPHTETHSP